MKNGPLRACVVMFVFSCMTVSVHAENGLRFDDWYGALDEGSIRFFKQGEAEIWWLHALWEGEKEQRFVTPYRIEYDHKVPFLRFGDNFQEKWLFLHSDYFVFACKSEKEEVFAACSEGGRCFHDIPSLRAATTSFLIEGDIRYVADNLKTFAPSHPWVEGVKGPGIGEKITVRADRASFGGGIKILIFSNGYVSYDKPYLYEKNSRVKRLRVTNNLEGFDFEVDLDDTPNPQLIFLPIDITEAELEILEVYPGSQWEDTCINFIWGIRQSISGFFIQE